MDKDLEVKYNNLKEYLKSLGSVAVAFSSGVDSTFLLKVAHDVLGDKVIAITLNSAAFPEKETNDARDFCKSEGIILWILKVLPTIYLTDVIFVRK